MHNSLLGKEEKERLKALFAAASKEWASKKTGKVNLVRLKRGNRLLRYADLFLSKGITVSKLYSFHSPKSISNLNILPPILEGVLADYLKTVSTRGPASWTNADLVQHIRSWGDELVPYAHFFYMDNLDGKRFLGLDRNMIKNLEILPTALEETLMNHITNLRRVQTDRYKSYIENSPKTKKAKLARHYSFCQTQAALQTPSPKKRLKPVPPKVGRPHSLSTGIFSPSIFDLSTPDMNPSPVNESIRNNFHNPMSDISNLSLETGPSPNGLEFAPSESNTELALDTSHSPTFASSGYGNNV